jgi:hypothetical protein
MGVLSKLAVSDYQKDQERIYLSWTPRVQRWYCTTAYKVMDAVMSPIRHLFHTTVLSAL